MPLSLRTIPGVGRQPVDDDSEVRVLHSSGAGSKERGSSPWRRRWSVAVVVCGLVSGTAGVQAGSSTASASPTVSVIVREAPSAGNGPELLVGNLGGTVGRQIALIDGFVADIPADRVDLLLASPLVVAVTENQALQLASYDGFDPKTDLGSMYWVAGEVTGAGEFWNDGIAGKGVDVALLDSGVSLVEGLSATGKVVYGPDLSFESQSDTTRDVDTFGHGTHMAGIIAGRDRVATKYDKGDESQFLGMAPDARIVSVKVADAYGATDVSQVLAGIDWIVQNRRSNGMNIRVLNLSFGTDGVQDYRLDPLTFAVEQAWHHGIVVVVAAGNDGYGSTELNNPAYDPYIIAVGGADGRDTYTVSDDVIGSFSSHGSSERRPDLVAPGRSIVSLRSPGSYADVNNPSARVGTRLLRGSGTSQAAAVVSGAAALIIAQRPNVTPDQVKALLVGTARSLPAADPLAQGAGMIDLKIARSAPTPNVVQTWPRALGTGSLDAARGSSHLDDGTAVLDGEQDIFGADWDSNRWSTASATGSAWAGGMWNGNRWSGDGWLGNRWSSAVWAANRWSGNRWSADEWSGNRWSGNRWSGNRWSGDVWLWHESAPRVLSRAVILRW
jgi:serine protease AprX